MTQEVKLDIYGVKVLLRSNSEELHSRIKKDFFFFLEKDLNASSSCDLKIMAILESKISFAIPSWPEIRRSKNSITYEKGLKRVNDYYGKLVSLFNYESEEAELYSSSIENLHEITYLLILSRTGKSLDLQGKHKVHALAFSYKGICCVGMMEMGVGKSTLLLELLKNPEVRFLSDDTPLIDSRGKVSSFPLRIGTDDFSKAEHLKASSEDHYELSREHYGVKKLISVRPLMERLGEACPRQVAFEGKRGRGPKIIEKGRFSLFVALQKHMVVGIGLPMILEYFWETGLRDFLRKTNIFFLRQRAALNFSKKSHFYEFSMSNNPAENAEQLLKLLDEVAKTSS